jgi:pSer/pThr/pTyr-binding forkhead associated (FHA) protein
MPPRLIALDTDHVILLDKPIILIGRHPECDIQLESRKISRRHCCIAEVDKELAVRDLGSTNGIQINGAAVEEGKLADGDELTIGNLRYQVRWEDGDAPPRPARPAAVPPPAVSIDHMQSLDIPIPIKEPHGHPVVDRRPVNGQDRSPRPGELRKEK